MGAGLFGALVASKEMRFQDFSAGAVLLMGNGACPCFSVFLHHNPTNNKARSDAGFVVMGDQSQTLIYSGPFFPGRR